MCTFYSFQFYLYTICIQIFTIYIYTFYYLDSLSTKEISRKYDYIIVGSGTAGSLIAHRLAVDTNFTYILVEAGPRGAPMLDIPVIGPLLHGSLYDWQYETVPQNGACLAMVGKKCKLPQGKITGGSAKLNNMVHVRGSIAQYVEWFNGKYSRDYFEGHFKYIEQNILPANDVRHESQLANAILEGAKELGYKILNINKNFRTGFMKTKVNQRDGKRWSAYDTLSQSKHNILTNTEVEKVLIDSNKVAYGIKYSKMSRKHAIYARKGIILSAGTFNTPKILQLSGIGPEEVLNKHNIKVLRNLPVGRNLQDHVATGLDLVLFNNSLNIGALDLLNPLHMLQYYLYGAGPLTMPGCEAIGFLSTTNSYIPDIQFMVLPIGITADRGSHLRKSLGITDFVWNNYFLKSFDKHAATIMPILLHPKSRGEVVIAGKNPKLRPLIDPKYLSSKEDVETLIKALSFVVNITGTNAMMNLGAAVNGHTFPNCHHFDGFSRSYWECYIRHLTLSVFHPVGTCPMGFDMSRNSVVDTSFNVIGFHNLFVADASVLPELPKGNVNAAVAMMANIFFETKIVEKEMLDLSKYCLKSDLFDLYNLFNSLTCNNCCKLKK